MRPVSSGRGGSELHGELQIAAGHRDLGDDDRVLPSYGAVGGQPDGQQVATATVTVANGLTLLSLALVVMHIHALAKSIMSETIVEWVGAQLDRGIAALPIRIPAAGAVWPRLRRQS